MPPDAEAVARANRSDPYAPLMSRHLDVGDGHEIYLETVGRAEMEKALGWQNTRLEFQDTPLDEAIAGFNRYNTRQLTLGDPALRRRRLSGTFRADNLEGFLRVVRFTVDVKAEVRTPAETVLLPIR